VAADLESAGRWLTDNVADLRAPLSIQLIAAGRSNLTYRVEDSCGRIVILRRPPAGHAVGDRSHDIRREHRVLLALSGLGLPVPRPLALCLDISVLGAEFLAMEFVAGQILRTRQDAEALSAGARKPASRNIIKALLRIHAVDVNSAGLADLSQHEGYLERQLRRWNTQLSTGHQPAPGSGRALLADTHRVLSSRAPVQQQVRVVHGDFRMDNVIIDADGSVASVLDWELCTLGDPLADLGILLASWVEPEDQPLTIAELEPTRAAGFSSREDLIATYRAGSTLDLADISYYYTFGLWKLACVLHGVRVRYEAGSVAGDLAGADQLGHIVDRLAAAANAQAMTF
jgi:aminoglycoside phosphotransferase (APT) family kinase protein